MFSQFTAGGVLEARAGTSGKSSCSVPPQSPGEFQRGIERISFPRAGTRDAAAEIPRAARRHPHNLISRTRAAGLLRSTHRVPFDAAGEAHWRKDSPPAASDEFAREINSRPYKCF